MVLLHRYDIFLLGRLICKFAPNFSAMSVTKPHKRITTNTLQEMKHNNEKISMLTAYDYSMAKIVDEAGIDIIL